MKTPQVKLSIVLALLLLVCRVVVAGDFSEILKAPQHFNAQRLTLVGVARVDADDFTLYKTADAAINNNLSEAVFVRLRTVDRKLDDLNGHWVRVTGVLDADRHGPLGVGYPCELLFEKVVLIAGRRLVRLPTNVEGRFRSEIGIPVHIRLLDDRGALYAEFGIGPNSVNSIGIRSGRAIIATQSGDPVTAGHIVVSVEPKLTVRGEKPKLYFRITRKGIEAESPKK